MTLTPARQRNAFSEGLALGLLCRKRLPLTYNKFSFERALERAFHRWNYASDFTAVGSEMDPMSRIDTINVVTHVNAPQQASYLYWDPVRSPLQALLKPQHRAPIDPEAVADAISGVPLDGWLELTDTLCEKLDETSSGGQ